MKKELIIFTIMHFLVDFSCIFRMFCFTKPACSSGDEWLLLIVIYNFLAFALPGLIGLISDIIDKDFYLAGAGCLLVGLSFISALPVFVPVILSGVGNGFFHVGCGRRILLESEDKYAPSGIFICSGALGVFLGNFLAGKVVHPLDNILCLFMFIAAAVLIWLKLHSSNARIGYTAALSSDSASAGRLLSLSALLLIAVVILRSFYGGAASYSWKNTFAAGLIFTLCIVAGKALGGILCDRIGIKLTTVISLLGAAVTVLFSGDSMFFGCLSILLFNMTMPLTLTLLAKYWRRFPGFAFGILMLGLFLGLVPSYAFGSVILPYYMLCLVCIISMVLLLIAVVRKKNS